MKICTLDEFEQAYRVGLGVPLPLKPWRTITEESVRRFGDGVGDYNPLWREPGYAKAGRYGELVASPVFLFALDLGVVASINGHIPAEDVSTRDLAFLYLGAEIEWHAPLWVGDRIRSVETPISVRRKQLRQINNALICSAEIVYWNSRGEKVATLQTNMLRFENTGATVESASGAKDDSHQTAPDPLVWNRERRGPLARYWEEVAEGDEIDTLPKGTYTTTELYLFSHGVYDTGRLPHLEEGTIDMGAGGRADEKYAREHRAQESNFDWGPQRMCWIAQAATDWMGDWGTLVALNSRIRRPNLVGDTSEVTGRVLGRRVEQGKHLVTLELSVVNQSGIVTADGEATIALPVEGGATLPSWRGESSPVAAGAYKY